MRTPETGHTTPTLFAEGGDGTMLAFRVFGGGDADLSLDPVVLVHGFASDSEQTWVRTGWVQALLETGRAVILPDLRGHGASGKPHEAAAYRAERFAADLLAVVNASGAELVDLVGYSLGTRVVSAFAALAPERVGRVVLGGSGPRELFSVWDLAEARDALERGVEPVDPLARQLLGPAIASGADALALLAVAEGAAGSPLGLPAGIPVLLVAGSEDPVPVGVAELAASWGAGFVSVPGRDHVSTLTSRVFKDAAIAFFDGDDAIGRAG